MKIPVVCAPWSVRETDDSPLIVVRRPALKSSTGQVYGHVAERLAVVIEGYATGGPRAWVPDGDPGPGARVPLVTEVVWCSCDERNQWDVGSGGRIGSSHGGPDGIVGTIESRLPTDAPRIRLAIARVHMAVALHGDRKITARDRVAERMLATGIEQRALAKAVAPRWGVEWTSAERQLTAWLNGARDIGTERLGDLLDALALEIRLT